MDTDLYVSYELDNFYQNQIEYQAAVDWYQIMGTQLSTEDECGSDFFSIGNQTYSPCGLIANSFFNDYFTLDYTNSLINGATPASDMKRDAATITSISTELFKQPEGFKKVQVANSVSCSSYSASDCTSAGLATNCKCYAGITSQTWLYFYPDDDTTRYLYESYPTAISPLDGVTNPHFMNWMDVASFAKFRKLYGKISGPFKKGDTLKFTIDSQYVQHY